MPDRLSRHAGGRPRASVVAVLTWSAVAKLSSANGIDETPFACYANGQKSHSGRPIWTRGSRIQCGTATSGTLVLRQNPMQTFLDAMPMTKEKNDRGLTARFKQVHAAELAVEPNFQILRRYRRPLLLRLEHAHRHVHRAPRLDSRRSLNLRIGITQRSLRSGSAI